MTITGLPAGVAELRVWVTDQRRGMQEGTRIPAGNGRAEIELEPLTFTTFIGMDTAVARSGNEWH